MFILTKVADLVQIEPKDFIPGQSLYQAIEDNINAKYANRVIQKIGLCICLYDLTSASDGLVGNGTGLVSVNVEFRLVVFRPFSGEIIMGRISSSTDAGIHLKTHFFDEIFVPKNRLPEGAKYSADEDCWKWFVDDEPLYFDNQETVRFRVEQEQWHDQTPKGPADQENNDQPQSPYKIIASMEDAGLGPCLWWDNTNQGEEEEIEEE
ncbi:RNA polymerase III subunit Rpc25 [Bisporella sp. PMI_857]|nr:RNA polymerase III subunit Rpc25 [Bisporella sp. PMI_857]